MLDYLFPPKLRGVFSSSLVTCSFYYPTPTAEPIPGHPSSSPGQLKEREKKKRKKETSPSPLKKKGGDTPPPRSGQEANEFPWRPPAGACLYTWSLCGGRGLTDVSAHGSLTGCRWSGTHGWSTCYACV